MKFEDCLWFFPERTDKEEAIRIYSITGGIPFYLAELDLGKSLIIQIDKFPKARGA